MNKFDPASHNITDEQRAHLKESFPEAFTEQGIDFDRLKMLLGEVVETGPERYSFTWPGKTEAIRAAQVSSMGTLAPDKASSVDWDTTENLYLEGDNLEILKLLQKSYTGKVKMIYIDPPYNTGNDFVYPDKYGEGLKTYLEYTGQIDGEGKKLSTNTETDGRYHSKWLNMMYPRLMLSRNLLKEDGVIFVSIDDHEVHNLRKIMDEVFGAENFIAQFIHKNNSSKNQSKLVSVSTEYFYCYAKHKENLKDTTWRIMKRGAKDVANLFNKLKLAGKTLEEIDEQVKELYARPKYSHLSRWNKVDEHGVFKDADLSREGGPKDYTITNPITGQPCVIPERGWGKSYEELLRLQQEDLIWYGDPNTPPGVKDYIGSDDESVPDNFWYFDNSVDTRWVRDVFGKLVFENPKPVEMIRQILQMSTKDHDIVLDFFSGSATTAHALLALNAEDGGNRKFILTQLQEPTPEDSEAKIAGYANIAQIGKDRIHRSTIKIQEEFKEKIASRENPIDLGFKVYSLTSSTFNVWDVKNEDDLQQKLVEATSLIKGDAKEEDVLTELILKSGYGLTEAIEQIAIGDKKLFSVAGGQLIVSLESGLTLDHVRQIAEKKPIQFVAREHGFAGDDVLTNTAQIMKDKGIDFRVL